MSLNPSKFKLVIIDNYFVPCNKIPSFDNNKSYSSEPDLTEAMNKKWICINKKIIQCDIVTDIQTKSFFKKLL